MPGASAQRGEGGLEVIYGLKAEPDQRDLAMANHTLLIDDEDRAPNQRPASTP